MFKCRFLKSAKENEEDWRLIRLFPILARANQPGVRDHMPANQPVVAPRKDAAVKQWVIKTVRSKPNVDLPIASGNKKG